MRKNLRIENWKLSWVANAEQKEKDICFTTPQEVKESGYPCITATAPGNVEMDFMREGLLDDIYMGANTVQTQKYENLS